MGWYTAELRRSLESGGQMRVEVSASDAMMANGGLWKC